MLDTMRLAQQFLSIVGSSRMPIIMVGMDKIDKNDGDERRVLMLKYSIEYGFVSCGKHVAIQAERTMQMMGDAFNVNFAQTFPRLFLLVVNARGICARSPQIGNTLLARFWTHDVHRVGY